MQERMRMSEIPKNDEIENVDVVNEECEVLFSVPKSEAHEKGLLHRTIIAEIKDKDGRWLLVRQAFHVIVRAVYPFLLE